MQKTLLIRLWCLYLCSVTLKSRHTGHASALTTLPSCIGVPDMSILHKSFLAFRIGGRA